MNHSAKPIRVAIACGGTGGHIFPGLAVAEQLRKRGCAVTLLLSPKEVDQQAVKHVSGMEIAVLPAVGLTRGGRLGFLRGFFNSLRLARKLFRTQPPQAVLAMGGFTSAPPVFAARLRGIPTFLHESNTIPGRANRLLARFVSRAFTGFPETANRLPGGKAVVTGTPVRPQFHPRDAAACRTALGLKPDRPVVLVMGGSQGAAGINDLVLSALTRLQEETPELQWLHLAGSTQYQRVAEAHRAMPAGHVAVVREFLSEMELALGAATIAVSRAGASSLAELAAVQLPAILIPYPAATDNHQLQNARTFAGTGAARVLEQKDATTESIAGLIRQMTGEAAALEKMRSAVASWHKPAAATEIADHILAAIARRLGNSSSRSDAADEGGSEARVCLGEGKRPGQDVDRTKSKEENFLSERVTA